MRICRKCKYVDVVRRLHKECRIPYYIYVCRRLQRVVPPTINIISGEKSLNGKMLYCYKARKKKKFCGIEGRWYKNK